MLKPLNVISMGRNKSDNINWMIEKLLIFIKVIEAWNMIKLSGFHCKSYFSHKMYGTKIEREFNVIRIPFILFRRSLSLLYNRSSQPMARNILHIER